jgi:hypothetical protein
MSETKLEAAMGRPPIGKVAMTATERVHRFRAKQRVDKPETKLETKPSATDRVVAALEAELERERVAHIKTLAKLEQVAKAAVPAFDELTVRVAALEAELSRERTRSKMFEAGLQNLRRQQRARSKSKAERPPLAPDEERDRQIKALKTRVRNLTAELHHTREHNDSKIAHDGGMNFRTMSAIANVLHPDRQPSETERAEACRLFTAWKADKDKARRQGR